MITGCNFNELTGEDSTTNICKKCQKRFNMPFDICCLEECGEHYFCEGCTGGIRWSNRVKRKNDD